MFYHISLGTPRSSVDGMDAFSFQIQLWPAWKEAVALCALSQENINAAIKNAGRSWLDSCGFNHTINHGNGDEPLYRPEWHIRVQWGEWGPEHITVPGNACGLDIDERFGRRVLLPHNVDSMAQAYLLMIVFTFFAESVILNVDVNHKDKFNMFNGE